MQQDIGQLLKEFQELVEAKAQDKATITQLQGRVQSAEERINAIQKILEGETKRTRRANSSPGLQISDGLKKIKYVKEAIDILTGYNYCLSVREIVNAIKVIKKIEDTPANDRFILNKLSNDLRVRAINKKDVNRAKIDGEYLYGLVDWFDAEGNPLPGCVVE